MSNYLLNQLINGEAEYHDDTMPIHLQKYKIYDFIITANVSGANVITMISELNNKEIILNDKGYVYTLPFKYTSTHLMLSFLRPLESWFNTTEEFREFANEMANTMEKDTEDKRIYAEKLKEYAIMHTV